MLAPVRAEIPARLSDKDFWALSERFSEPNGEFQSDNFLSNERGYQAVIPELIKTAKAGRIYLGVGPEQNYPYILALKPQLAIIFDVRRGNLHEQLLYKAIFEMSSDRVDFLSRLFCRPKPEGVTPASSIAAIMAAFQNVSPTEEIYTKNFKDVADQLTVKHGFALHADDLNGIDYVYKTAFYNGGPNLTYNMAGRGSRGGGRGGFGSTYADIQALDDGTGLNRGFLANEENWKAMKDMEERNLILPVVGDFAGSKAIRGVGAWLKEQGAVVSAFYLSNVEQYLNRNGVEDVFLCNVAQLPLDDTSTFIFTGAGRFGGGFGGGGRGGGGGLNTTFLRPMLADAKSCAK
ncbi:MAG: hypothetical protein EPO35_04925 [Acidobacteria bacterium]|nr:MAG: hypothetical protein EPO35_04925 [Acidobacteriota bacterium]